MYNNEQVDEVVGRISFDELKDCSRQVCKVLKVMQNQDRLLLLCALVSEGDLTVSEMGTKLGIEQPMLSQQLTVLRKYGLVETERNGKNIYYSIRDERIQKLMGSMKEIFGKNASPLDMEEN